MTSRLLVISPVRNEGAYLDRTISAMAAQTRPPDRWIVVDDGSEDGTAELLERAVREVPFLEVVRTPTEDHPATGRDRLALAAAPRAFNRGLAASGDWRAYTHIAKLDGDVELPADYYDRLLARFEDSPELGMACGDLVERFESGWRVLPIPRHHVHGALKLYTRECFEAIGGLRELLGWDTIDETYARMKGFRTHSFPDLVARHHRHFASADGRLRGRARHGECAYVAHFTLPWVALRAFKVARARPIGLSGVAFLYGYLRAGVRRTPRVPDREFRRFVHRELRGRMLAGASRLPRLGGAMLARRQSAI